MAPDRGSSSPRHSPKYKSISRDHSAQSNEEHDPLDNQHDEANQIALNSHQRSEAYQFLAERANEDQNFTLRGVLVGLAIGVIICFSNTYFGLQTGWVSGMAMPAALIGFAFFKTIAKHINYPFTPVENVLVQTVAGAVGTMPLGCGFVGVLPALNYLLTPEENGPLILSTWKLMVWAVGICFFGVFIAVPLRREVLIREKLKFPSGTATALMIGVLHGNTNSPKQIKQENAMETFRRRSQDAHRSLDMTYSTEQTTVEERHSDGEVQGKDHRDDWKAQIRLLVMAFGVSAIYVQCISCESKLENTNINRHLYPISSPNCTGCRSLD